MSRLAEETLRRHRLATATLLILLAALAWTYLLTGAGMGGMESMAGAMAMPSPGFAVIAAMWWVMMIAMMVPSAAPTILLYGTVARRRVDLPGDPPTGAFLSGYLVCWLIFAFVAAAAQLWLESAKLASPGSMALYSRSTAAVLLIVTGLYQLSPLKGSCLVRCRSPAEFLTRHYRPGARGAFEMGLIHGAYCVGCCWMLMLLLFVGGVMNFAWIAGLALLVAAEKMLPLGDRLARLAGLAMIGCGAWLLAA